MNGTKVEKFNFFLLLELIVRIGYYDGSIKSVEVEILKFK